ncbi:MAG TPA: trypsin-like peptidase domain-containing protein [Lacipirellulaceae bacterium]|nr:trypsin-like peptidase domain-containing protein [Lacipirellulaceae bacterium]
MSKQASHIEFCKLKIANWNVPNHQHLSSICNLQFALCILQLLLFTGNASAAAPTPDPAVLAAESARVETIARIARPTIAIFDPNGQGGGSGVIISHDGYALTNFHVANATGVAMKCGLSDGRFVDAVIVGLDPSGDVALVKLIGKDDFPVAEMGDSDTARVGQWVYVVGNPFLLADDFKPTVTYGILSGVHRYQYPAGTLLEYADCLQTDAAINPGNSGGPMFDSKGRLIGINGRGSFEKRGRVNVGVGYAISINQIKRFTGLLKSGRVVDHATLGATVSTDSDQRVVVDDILDDSDAYRRGLRYGDELVRFGGRDISSANAFKNVLGTYPNGWRVPLTYRRDGKEHDIRVRLAALHLEGELQSMLSNEHEPPVPDRPRRDKEPKPDDKRHPEIPGFPKPGDHPKPGEPGRHRSRPARTPHQKVQLPSDVRPYYEESPGYVNYWFNRYNQQRVWNAYLARGDFADAGWNWKIKAKTANGGDVLIELNEKAGSIIMPEGKSGAEFGSSLTETTSPARSGGLLAALHLWQRLLIVGPRHFGEVYYLGTMPWNRDDKLDDCLVATNAGVETRFYFDPDTGNCTGFELRVADDEDPCEIYFDDIRQVDGRSMPFHWTVRHGDDVFTDLKITAYDWSGGSKAANGK